ncbi:MAG: hypothetical protein ABMA00_11085 [Gemmatimonas sp.]
MRLDAVFPLAVLLAVSACNSPARDVLNIPTAPASTVPMGTDFTLAPGESVVVNSDDLTLTFVGVTSESRCPTNALIQCIWAGSARISLRATSAAGTRDVGLETMATKDVETIDRFVVRLVAVTPAPITTDPIPAASYRATLRMSTK